MKENQNIEWNAGQLPPDWTLASLMAKHSSQPANPTMTLAEVAAEIGKSLSAVERASAKLVMQGRLRYYGPSKGGHWEVLEVLK
ncbi:hypothetical protein [Rhodoferax ferrireducens]|uniref:hypothetical protein n=1 Tax=Rhodoferax ferrireducens TaxID=192843 RepID=UPI000E0D8621|nr:hypothetical protein [Rhodoferax ferrireducens]